MLPSSPPAHRGISSNDLQAYTADALTSGASVAASFTRPADTTAYTAGDAVGAASAILTYAGIAAGSTPGRNIMITSAALRIDINAVPAGMSGFRLHLYSASPDSIADNAVWDLASAGDRAKYQGYIDFAAPIDLGSTLYAQADSINHQVQLADGASALFGVLVTTGAFTPSASTAWTVNLRALSV
jgi:hypothetical protein